MTRNLIYNFLRDLVLTTPRKPIGGLNAFFVDHTDGEYALPSFGKSYEDYINGYLWLRDWSIEADPSKIEREWPFLQAINFKLRVSNLDDSISMVCSEFELRVAAPRECKTCKQYFQTVPEIEEDALNSLVGIIKSFDTAKLYQYDTTDLQNLEPIKIGLKAIFTDEMKDYLTTNGLIENVVKLGDVTITSIADFQSWGIRTADRLHGYGTTVKICLCQTFESEFEYNSIGWKKAVLKCNVCP